MKARFVLSSVLAGFLLALLFAQTAWAQKDLPDGAMGVSETMRDLMDREARAAKEQVPAETEAEHEPVNRKGLPQNPNASASPYWPPRPFGMTQPLSAISPLSPQTVSTTFTGATLAGTNPTSAFPGDTMGAAGPTQFIVMVNGRIVSFNKTTGVADGVMNLSTNTFFTSVRNGSGTSDPRIRYDRLSGRWFLLIINVSTPNRILLAVSNSASNGTITASTVWTYFFTAIDTPAPAIANTCLMDYPTLGIDVNALYVGGNNFCGSPTQTFNSTDGWVFRKSSVLGAGPLVVTVFRALATGSAAGPYTPQGVDNFSSTATEGYFIGVDTLTYGKLYVRRVSTPGGTPTISANIALNVSTTAGPITVPHLGNTGGTNGNLDGLDDRLFAAHLRNGRLWTAHSIGVDSSGAASATPTRNGTRWYELQNLTGTPSVVQSGTVFDSAASNPKSYWIPSIMVSGQGHAALGFSSAGGAARANAATVGRLSGDSLSTMQTPAEYTTSSTAYNPSGDTGVANGARRWGDYSFTSVDPSDDMTMWTIQEFCDATNSYGVKVAKLLAPPPATPTVVPQVPGTAISVVGTVVSGSGFFDPGTDPPAGPAFTHLTASITKPAGNTATGTLAISSATYTDATNLSLVMTTTGDVSGAYNLVVTNPDGQSITSTSYFNSNIRASSSGTGTGTLSSVASGISGACTAGCLGYFPVGTPVVLTASPTLGSTFTGWSGACSGTGTCSITPTSSLTAQSAVATFTSVGTFNLTTSVIGSGSIANLPAGTSCGASCATYNTGTSVALTPTASAGYVFSAWGGDCSGSGACNVTMSAAHAVSATFIQTFNLTTSVTGSGSIANLPTGTSCGASCATYNTGTSVALTPTASAGYVFSAWGGNCSGSGSCNVTMSAARAVSATFIPLFNLTVTTAGSGTGSVANSPTGTSCGTGCATYSSGTSVTLTATATAGSAFTGWSGGDAVAAGCNSTAPCTLAMTSARAVTATFVIGYNLLTSTGGNGSGTIGNAPAGISCGTGCATYNSGTVVTLTPAPGAFSNFTSWSGACTGAGPCSVTMDASKSVGATFTLQTFTLSVTKSGTGTGTVTSDVGGIACGASCGATYDAGTIVALTATPGAFSAFSLWSGACAGTGACNVTMDAAQAVSATFVKTGAGLYTAIPCRMYDSRPPTLPGTPIAANGTVTVVLTGTPCGIPTTATAVSVNLTVTQPSDSGSIVAYAFDQPLPGTSNLSFSAGITRANNAIVRLPADTTGRIKITNTSAGTIHVIVDVAGYVE
ncbi:MAG: hypothetical protein ABIT01_13440 [Thermoanaerobaculia bacterium]